MDNIELLKKIKDVIDGIIDELESVNKAEEEKVNNFYLKMPIEDLLDLSIRAYNSLHYADVKYLKDLRKFKHPSQLMYVRNLGKKSVQEIVDELKRKGLYELIWK